MNSMKTFQKHSMLYVWDSFNESCIEIEKKKRKDHIVKKIVKRCIDCLKVLEDAKFFIPYAKFVSTTTKFNDKYAHYVDADNNYIEMAAKVYFSMLFGKNCENPEVEIVFRPKEKSGCQVRPIEY